MTLGEGLSVALVTSAANPNLTADDRLAAAALDHAGFATTPEVWDAATRPWEEFDAVVLRSCWDYHRSPDDFDSWLDELERREVRLFNSVATIRWNSRKTYLRDLDAAGIPVVPTAWMARGNGATLGRSLQDNGWERVVVKPLVSATAFQTWQAGPSVSAEEEARFAEQLSQRDLMVQPFVDELVSEGELSFMFLGGRYSHAVLKRAKPGDFRVQEDFGGTVDTARPDPALVDQVARTLAVAPAPCLYARVDGCVIDGRLVVMEFEAIEPVLFFGREPAAASRFAEALKTML